jgi:non-heme chloroperoxidase
MDGAGDGLTRGRGVVAPVLVGHSLGGVVVQKWLKDHEAAGVVLMGSGPSHGMLPSSLAIVWDP